MTRYFGTRASLIIKICHITWDDPHLSHTWAVCISGKTLDWNVGIIPETIDDIINTCELVAVMVFLFNINNVIFCMKLEVFWQWASGTFIVSLHVDFNYLLIAFPSLSFFKAFMEIFLPLQCYCALVCSFDLLSTCLFNSQSMLPQDALFLAQAHVRKQVRKTIVQNYCSLVILIVTMCSESAIKH